MKKNLSLQHALFLCFCLHFFACKPAHKQAIDIDTTGFRQELKEAWQQTSVGAIAFGFVNSEGQAWTQTFGSSTRENGDSLTADHIFRLASMTKAITSVGLMQLVEKGSIGLDDPVGIYLPEIDAIPLLNEQQMLLNEYQVPVTVRHLLTHTSGFGYAFRSQKLQNFSKSDRWPHKDHPRVHEAGENWTYGTGTDWAGYLIETVSGMNLEEYFRENITVPLRMHHTWFDVPDSLLHLTVTLGKRTEGAKSDVEEISYSRPHHIIGSYSGGSGLHASLNDYLRFLACIVNQGEFQGVQILQKETVASLFEDQLPYITGEEHSAIRHSLAWALEGPENDFGRREGSAYWSGIFNTYYSLDINTGIAVVVMTNLLPFPDEEALGLYKLFESMVRM